MRYQSQTAYVLVFFISGRLNQVLKCALVTYGLILKAWQESDALKKKFPG